MTIQGYNADSLRAIGQIHLKCHLAYLKSEIICYVIDNNMSYNLLLGRPWIQGNFDVPSTLYQCHLAAHFHPKGNLEILALSICTHARKSNEVSVKQPTSW